MHRAAYLVVNDFAEPLAIAMKDEAVDAHVLVVSNAHLLDQARLVAEVAQRSHEPAVSISALAHIIGCRSVYIKLRVVKDVNDSLDGLWTER